VPLCPLVNYKCLLISVLVK